MLLCIYHTYKKNHMLIECAYLHKQMLLINTWSLPKEVNRTNIILCNLCL